MTRKGTYSGKKNYTRPGGVRKVIPIKRADEVPAKPATCNLTLNSKNCREKRAILACTRSEETCIGAKFAQG